MARQHFGIGLRAHWDALHICALLHLLGQRPPIRPASRRPQNLLRTLKRSARRDLRLSALVEVLLRLRHLGGNFPQATLQPAPVHRRLRACAKIANIPTLVRRDEVQPIECFLQIVPALQDTQAPVQLGKTFITLRLILAGDELLHRIERRRRHAQIAHKLIVRTRPQLLQIPVRLNPLAARQPALLR